METVIGKKMKFRARDPLSALTHFIGFLAVIPPVICLLERSETTAQVVSFAIFGISLLLLYGASTIYHTLCLAPEKIAFLRRIDHMMIFVLIAGTYTPVCMVILPGIWGKALLAAVWGIAIFGIFMKIFWMNAPRWLSTLIYVGMGWLDRKDVLQWIDWVLAQDSEAEIVLHGVSMGAATTMMTAGEDTPEQVKVFVEDCGYTSVWDIFSSELKLRFGLPEFPILYTASATARAKAGYGFKEASALQQVQNCEKPMLFIHGTADDFIPYEMMGTLYNAKPGTNKATLTAEGAGHGEAMDVLGDTYWNTVFDFEGQYMAG